MTTLATTPEAITFWFMPKIMTMLFKELKETDLLAAFAAAPAEAEAIVQLLGSVSANCRPDTLAEFALKVTGTVTWLPASPLALPTDSEGEELAPVTVTVTVFVVEPPPFVAVSV
jgi:hypothetical protein